jgi:DNA-directed RNA polymerase specialized sigma24 family protein
MTRNPADAENLVQETSVTGYGSFPEYGAHSKHSCWLDRLLDRLLNLAREWMQAAMDVEDMAAATEAAE